MTVLILFAPGWAWAGAVIHSMEVLQQARIPWRIGLYCLLLCALHQQRVYAFADPRPATSNPNATPDHDVIIIGGSLVGLATAASVAAQGGLVSAPSLAIFEKARSIRPIGALLSLFPNGLAALRSLGHVVSDHVDNVAIPLTTSIIKSGKDGEVIRVVESSTTKGNDDSANESGNFLCWYELQQILMKALPSVDDVINLGVEFVSYSVDDETGLVSVKLKDRNNGSHEFNRTCQVLIGADGVHSSVRSQMLGKKVKLNSYNRTIFRALLQPDTLSSSSSSSSSDVLLPPVGTAVIYKSDAVGQIFKVWTASNETLAITATVNSEDSDNDVRTWSQDEAKKRMVDAFADFEADEVQNLLQRMPISSIYSNAVSDIDCLDVWCEGPIVVIGDAAHCMTPSLGQGANIGLEDAVELGHFLHEGFVHADLEQEDHMVTIILQEVINEFCAKRLERTQEIHSASRVQALNKNKQDTTLGAFRKRDPAFFARLFGWKPTSSPSGQPQG